MCSEQGSLNSNQPVLNGHIFSFLEIFSFPCFRFVILLFVILTLIRSAVSVYESCKAIGKESHSSLSERKEKAADGATYAEEEKKLFETSIYAVFLTNLKKILDCFCIKSNARRILNTVSTQEQLSSLHGIRAIIVIWVLVGHVSMLYLSAVKTPDKVQLTLDLQGTQIIKNTIFIVDTFLVLSGFLNGYLFSQHYEEKKGNISWLLFYVRRFVRKLVLQTHNKFTLTSRAKGGVALLVTVNLWQTRFASEGGDSALLLCHSFALSLTRQICHDKLISSKNQTCCKRACYLNNIITPIYISI
ncbi:hypothetical protein AVEN_231786-1 [Araneus ventricosus]|uniref:Acyltransferase 3 domain-containing protein n=1 Tax=Araneus ventricosus TaxID=182803 RepID=A0A4Y2P6V3_ARAVE|nr:hypothetical protein AVEN_231786-1 [Araneus ventricosus]